MSTKSMEKISLHFHKVGQSSGNKALLKLEKFEDTFKKQMLTSRHNKETINSLCKVLK